jgi:hypothetical protein
MATLRRVSARPRRDGILRFSTPEGRQIGVTTPIRAPEPRRARSILTIAAVAAVLVNAGVAWTYWRVTETGPRQDGTGPAVRMSVPARSDLDVPLAPGSRGNLLVTLVNTHDFAVRITSVTAGPGKVVADEEHRDAGCTDPAVALTRGEFPVRWDVRKNTIGAFTIPNGLIRGTGGDRACAGAVFTVPIQAAGAGHRF